MTKEQVLLNTMELAMDCEEDYEGVYDLIEFEQEYLIEFIQGLIEQYEKQYNTSVVGLMLLGGRYSHYGAIGGNGLKTGKVVSYRNLSDIFLGDDMIVTINEDNQLELTYLDHDGRNTVTMSMIVESDIYNYDYSGTPLQDLLCDVIGGEKKWTKNYKVPKKFRNQKTMRKV